MLAYTNENFPNTLDSEVESIDRAIIFLKVVDYLIPSSSASIITKLKGHNLSGDSVK